MVIDITKLNTGVVNEMEIKENFSIPSNLYQNLSIISLDNLLIDGIIKKVSANLITLNAKVFGVMILEDSISLEPLDYPFSCIIEEDIQNLMQKSSNLLDITDILWQNILLEVPLKFSKVEDFSEYQGDGWKLVSEDSIKNTNNPFNELKDMLREE